MCLNPLFFIYIVPMKKIKEILNKKVAPANDFEPIASAIVGFLLGWLIVVMILF